MLNGGVSMSNSERTVVKQSTINSNRNLLTTVQAQQQQQLHLPQQEQPQEYHIQFETVNAELHNCLRAPTEPEYQNTRLHSPISEFYRGVHFNKSVRSNENMCETDLQHSKRDGQWNRIRPGLSTSIPTGDTFQSTRSHGRSSVLNHSYTSTITPHPFVNHQQQRLNQTVDVLNLSSTTSPTNFMPIANGSVKMIANGGLHIPKSSPLTPVTPTSVNRVSKTDSSTDVSKDNNNNNHANENNNGDANAANDIFGNGVKEILTSLGLLCLISLLLALLSLIFLLKISPVTATDMKDLLRAEQFTIISPDEYVTVYEVTLALCALSLSLNLCCLLVCSVQFLFAVKLTRSSIKGDR